MLRLRRVIGAKVRLVNATTNRTIAVVTAPAAFSLATDTRWPEEGCQWIGCPAGIPPLRASDVVLLQPGQVQTVSLRFTDAEWFVVRSTNKEGRPVADRTKPVPLGEAAPEWGFRFPVEYAPPQAAACAGVPGAEQVWHGRLASRPFGPAE